MTAILTRSEKLLGQVNTPRAVVDKMLDDIGFDGNEILGKTILDPACGDGNFLVAIAERIIKWSPPEDFKTNLEKLYGWEIDSGAAAKCLDNLNDLVKGYGVQMAWNLEVCDTLRRNFERAPKFDFIVGNPPYIRSRNLAEQDRQFIRSTFSFCQKGALDTYLAFFELASLLLKEDGLCAFLTPNSFLHSGAALRLRAYFKETQCIHKISNYASTMLFERVGVCCAITLFGRKRQHTFIYEEAQSLTAFKQRMVDYSEIRGEKVWRLSLKKVDQSNGVKLGDICRIHVGITTLCDKAYIFKVRTIPGVPNLVVAETRLRGLVALEKEILRPIIKVSRLKSAQDPITEYILFPYEKMDGKHRIIPEERLKARFPFAYHYLLSVKRELDKRDKGKPNRVAWYAFGRHQGLDTGFGKKILFSSMNKHPNFILVENEECTFYSGYCIKFDGDYEVLLPVLNSEKMVEFMAISGRDFRGGWKGYNKQTLAVFATHELSHL